MWLIIPAIPVIFIAIIVIRTLLFTPKAPVEVSEKEISFEKDDAVESLRELVRCKTVSFKDSTLEDNAEFEKLINKLQIGRAHV